MVLLLPLQLLERYTSYNSFWWGLMVLTTVGYGSTAPSTATVLERYTSYNSFWWGLRVLTTVGYGSTAPSTAAGKVH